MISDISTTRWRRARQKGDRAALFVEEVGSGTFIFFVHISIFYFLGGEWDLSPSVVRAGDETFQEVAQVNPWSSV